MRHIKITFATTGDEPHIVVCAPGPNEHTICGQEAVVCEVNGIANVEDTKARINCPLCIDMILHCQKVGRAEIVA